MDRTDKLELLSGFDALGLQVTRMEQGGSIIWLGERQAAADELVQARFAGARRAKSEAVNRQRDAVTSSGFHHNFGPGVGTRTLDQRGPSDETAWLGLKSLSDDLVAMGEGDTMLSIRDAANQTFDVPASAVSEAIRTMGVWRALVSKRSWDLKDQVEQASDQAALDAIDIIAGWP